MIRSCRKALGVIDMGRQTIGWRITSQISITMNAKERREGKQIENHLNVERVETREQSRGKRHVVGKSLQGRQLLFFFWICLEL
jgi:hypothetical protein